MKPPSKALKNHCAQPISISRRGGTVIHRAVALDAKEISARLSRVHNTQVDSVPGTANLRVDSPSPSAEHFANLFLEYRLAFFGRSVSSREHCLRAFLRVFQEML